MRSAKESDQPTTHVGQDNHSIFRFSGGAFAWLIFSLGMTGLARGEGGSHTDKFVERGAYGTGVTTILVANPRMPTPALGSCPSRPIRKLVTEVWYPSEDASQKEQRDATPKIVEGGFPLIVFAHGLNSTRGETNYIGRHLSSHGFIVAAPDFPLSNGDSPCGTTPDNVPGQVSDVMHLPRWLGTYLRRKGGSLGAQLAAQIDETRVGLAGFSLGGTTVILAGDLDKAVKAVAMLAPAACPLFLPKAPQIKKPALTMPTLIIHGSTDAVLQHDRNVEPLFRSNAEPKYVVEISKGSHAGFLGDKGFYVEGKAAELGRPMDTLICGVLKISRDPKSPNALCKVCDPPIPPDGPQISVARQQELTKALLLAFFNGYLRCKTRDLEYLQKRFYQENIELKGRFKGDPAQIPAHCSSR